MTDRIHTAIDITKSFAARPALCGQLAASLTEAKGIGRTAARRYSALHARLMIALFVSIAVVGLIKVGPNVHLATEHTIHPPEMTMLWPEAFR